MSPRNYPNIQQPGTDTTIDAYGQAVVQNTIKLAIGVTLGGKGAVLSVDPGSRAEAAGLRTGDVINQINGR
jgi:S1-C subfamily serine protease